LRIQPTHYLEGNKLLNNPKKYGTCDKNPPSFLFESCNIVSDKFPRIAKSGKDIGFKEFYNDRISSSYGRDGFYPFGEVFCGSQDPFALGKGWRINFTNEIQSQLLERTFNRDGFQG